MRNYCASLWLLLCCEFILFSLYLVSYFCKNCISSEVLTILFVSYLRELSPRDIFIPCPLLEEFSLNNVLIHVAHLCEQQCMFANSKQSFHFMFFLIYTRLGNSLILLLTIS